MLHRVKVLSDHSIFLDKTMHQLVSLKETFKMLNLQEWAMRKKLDKD